MKILSFYNIPFRKTACGPNTKAHILYPFFEKMDTKPHFSPSTLHIYTFCNSLFFISVSASVSVSICYFESLRLKGSGCRRSIDSLGKLCIKHKQSIWIIFYQLELS